MQKILPAWLVGRRQLTVAAVGVLLGSLLLFQHPGIKGVDAGLKTTVIAPCTSGFISAAPSNPQEPGASVTLTAGSGGCGSSQFKFLLLAPGTSTWVAKTTYGSSSMYAWDTTGAAEGVWQIAVWVRATGSTVSYQAYAIAAYSLVVQHCTGAAVEYTELSGPPIDLTINASASGCPTPLFEWRELLPGSSTWTTVQPYFNIAGGGAQFHTTFAPGHGAHRFVVLAKQTGSVHSYDTYQILTVWF